MTPGAGARVALAPGAGARVALGPAGRPAAHHRAVQPAHLGERLQVAVAGHRAGRVAAEQGERVRQAQRAPHLLELDGVVDQPGVPEQGDHLAVGADRALALARVGDQAADHAVEGAAVELPAGRQRAYRVTRVQGPVGAGPGRRGQVNAGPRQAPFERPPVRRGGDDHRRPVVLQRAQQVAGHPVGEFLLVTVELDDVPAVQVFRPCNHRSSPSGASHVGSTAYLPSNRRCMHDAITSPGSAGPARRRGRRAVPAPRARCRRIAAIRRASRGGARRAGAGRPRPPAPARR